MWQGFTIALREGIEAFLIVALTLSYLARTGRGPPSRGRSTPASRLSVVTCAAAGWLFSKAVNQPLWEGHPGAGRGGPRRQPPRLHEARRRRG